MSFRTIYGRTHSLNGWRNVNRDGCVVANVVPYSNTAPVRRGDAATILNAWLLYYHRNIEPISTPIWGWSATNSVASSNHLSGTALDIHAPKYPFRLDRMPAAIKAKVEQGLRLFEGTIAWGGHWTNPLDQMHYELGYREGDQRIAAFAGKLNSGHLGIYGEPKPTPAPKPLAGLTAETLSKAMGGSLSIARYRELLPGFVNAMRAADITTVNRAAMWCAQIGHESLGLRHMEEIRDGAAYEGRADLGNTQPGDGRRFKGSGPIQLTGRHNFTQFSRWAAANGHTTDPMLFVNRPELVRTNPTYGFLAASWYWTVARPQLNRLSDARDLVGATKAINGGTNGLTDRQLRWNVCLALGTQLLPAPDTGGLTMADINDITDRLDLILDQMGPKHPTWSDESSFGLTADGHERTMRDGLIAKLDRMQADIDEIRKAVQ